MNMIARENRTAVRSIMDRTEIKLSKLLGVKVYLSHNIHEREVMVVNKRGGKVRVRKTDIKNAVCDFYEITEEDLCNRKRDDENRINARRMYLFIAYEIYRIGTFKDVAASIGLTNHSTCKHHVDTMRDYLDIYKEKRFALDQIISTIEGL